MMTVVVPIQVKPDGIEAFREATLVNVRHSRQERGVGRFDLLQQADDPCRFLRIEGYRPADAPAAHKGTAHYQMWRETVAPMMAAPRTSPEFYAFELAEVGS